MEDFACPGIPDPHDQLGLGGALGDGDGIPIREGALLGGKDVVDGDRVVGNVGLIMFVGCAAGFIVVRCFRP